VYKGKKKGAIAYARTHAPKGLAVAAVSAVATSSTNAEASILLFCFVLFCFVGVGKGV
jgi:hypothetical protein